MLVFVESFSNVLNEVRSDNKGFENPLQIQPCLGYSQTSLM